MPTPTATVQPAPASTPTLAPWPATWMTFHHDSRHTGDGSTNAGSTRHAISPVWKFKTGGSVGSPAVGAGGLIYAGSGDGNLYCVNSNGTLHWSVNTGAAVASGITIGADGTLYAGAGFNEVAVTSSGSLKWKFSTAREIIASSTLSNDGATLYVGSFDHNIYAINTADGTQRWKFVTQDGIDATPTLSADGTIYEGSYDGYEYALNPDGSMKWKYNSLFLIEDTAVVDNFGFILVANDFGAIVALDPALGTPVGGNSNILLVGAPVYSSLALGPSAGGTSSFYLSGSDGMLYKYSFLESALGPLLPLAVKSWSFQTTLPFFSSPSVSLDNIVFVGAQDHNFYGFDGASGALLAQFPMGGPTDSSPAIGFDGTVYIGNTDGNLYAFH